LGFASQGGRLFPCGVLISDRISAVMPDIFISYRREDTSGYAGRIYDQLSAHFGTDHVFMDVAAIEPGSDFVDTIENRVGTCDALVAIVGKNWLTIRDEQNRVRLGSPEDFVSIEVAAALKRNVEVIPVLVGGAKMPLPNELPESLQLLSRRQALEISDVHFTRQVSDLIEALKRPAGTRADLSRRRIKLILALSICAVAAGIGIWIWQSSAHLRETVKSHLVTRDSNRRADTVPPISSSIASGNNDISGSWKAVVRKENVKYEIYFTFEVVGENLLGKVIYPTGEAGILDGTIRQGRIHFTTKHVPNFAEQETTITVEGIVSGDQIEVFAQDKDGYSKGVAHRVAQTSNPKY
jgi:hypothetical protein